MWVSMLGMWGCRVVAGYTLGIMLGMGVSASGWDGARLGGARRAVLLANGERALAVEISRKYREITRNRFIFAAKWRINRQTTFL
jgi:hypothetical protein